MISDDFKEIMIQLKEQGKMRFFDGATDEQISKFEEKCGVKLPQKYREWLLCSDGGEFFLPAGLQMYGVAHMPIIDVNDMDCPDDKYIVIGSLASGDPILCEKNGEKISIYNLEGDCIEADEEYENFADMLKDLYSLLGIGE